MAHPLTDAVRAAAGGRCEYCHLPAALALIRYAVDHVIARQHGGGDRLDNLAYTCDRCNQHKGPNIAGIDPDTHQLTRLFHPRHDTWEDHFEWSGHVLVGKTAVGRATVAVLAINDEVHRSVRAALMLEGVFAP